MATAATPSLRRVNQSLPGPGGGGGGGGGTSGGGSGRTPAHAPTTRGISSTMSVVESLMRESADGVDVSGRLSDLKRAILTDGISADDMGMSSHRIYIWLVLLRTPVLSYDVYAAFLKRGASPAYAKINDDTHRTLATDPLFARRVSQNSIARLLNTIAWALEDANRLKREAAASQGVAVVEPPKVVTAQVEVPATPDQPQAQTQAAQAAGKAKIEAGTAAESSAAQIAEGMAALELRTKEPGSSSAVAAESSTSGTASNPPAQTPTSAPTSSGTATPRNPLPIESSSTSQPSVSAASTSVPAAASEAPASLPSSTPSASTEPTTTAQNTSPPTSTPQSTSTPSSAPAIALPAPYVQGMNVLAAPFLYTARSEPQAHAGLFSLLARHVPSYITPTMSGVHLGLGLVDRLLALLDPGLSAHLTAKGLTASVYAFPAVLTLSACTPPLPEVLILWDFLLAWGVHLNLLAVVAQLHLLRGKLLKSESPMRELRSLGPLRAKKTIDLVVAFVGRVPEEVYREMVAHTGGGEG